MSVSSDFFAVLYHACIGLGNSRKIAPSQPVATSPILHFGIKPVPGTQTKVGRGLGQGWYAGSKLRPKFAPPQIRPNRFEISLMDRRSEACEGLEVECHVADDSHCRNATFSTDLKRIRTMELPRQMMLITSTLLSRPGNSNTKRG
jgi:hypothetical protein